MLPLSPRAKEQARYDMAAKVADFAVYPFEVVSRRAHILGCGLEAGDYPLMEHFDPTLSAIYALYRTQGVFGLWSGYFYSTVGSRL